MMKKIFFILTLTLSLFATPNDVATMLDQAKNAFSAQETIDHDRERRFLDALKDQNRLLKEAIEEVARLKQESIRLNDTIDSNEKRLSLLEERLHQRSGNLGELYGVVRQSAGDMFGQLEASSTSAQRKDRLDFLQTLSKTTRLPNIETLSEFWFIMLEELTLQGQNTKVTLGVIAPNGTLNKEEVLLSGLFSAVTKDGFVEYSPNSKTFSLLGKQPSGSYTSVASDAFEGTTMLYETVLDPTRGQLLSLSTESPTLEERIDQGSTIGYLILILGAFGILYALYKGVKLILIDRSIDTKAANSPVVRLIALYENKKRLNIEQIELALQERLSKERTNVERGLALVKLLAAVAPLMGLLGTVTGMIATFSAITLFGTGDPKLMAGGISQALITTVEGLVVAIPMLFAYTLLNSKTKMITAHLDEVALQLLADHENQTKEA